MKIKFKCNKLVRDKLPQLLGAIGINMNYNTVAGDEYIKALQAKMFEEAEEVVEAENAEKACEELADIVEVVKALALVYGTNFDEIMKIAEQKAAQKGGFKDGVYCNTIEMDEDNEGIEYYRAQSQKYPEMK